MRFFGRQVVVLPFCLFSSSVAVYFMCIESISNVARLFSICCSLISYDSFLLFVEGSTRSARGVHHEPSLGGLRGPLRHLSRSLQPLRRGLVRHLAHQGSRTGILGHINKVSHTPCCMNVKDSGDLTLNSFRIAKCHDSILFSQSSQCVHI